MLSSIFESFGNKIISMGYLVNYSIVDKGNSTKLPLVEIDIKTTSTVVFQTISNINKVDFDLVLYREALKTDISDLDSLKDFEDIKKEINTQFRAWNISQSISGFYGFNWSFAGQGINKEFAQNKPVKMFVLNCSIQYSDI